MNPIPTFRTRRCADIPQAGPGAWHAANPVASACMDMLGFSLHWRNRASRLGRENRPATSQPDFDVTAP